MELNFLRALTAHWIVLEICALKHFAQQYNHTYNSCPEKETLLYVTNLPGYRSVTSGDIFATRGPYLKRQFLGVKCFTWSGIALTLVTQLSVSPEHHKSLFNGQQPIREVAFACGHNFRTTTRDHFPTYR
jgi:hypothetical protein